MRRSRKTEITVETDRLVVVEILRRPASPSCPLRAGQAEMVTVDDAAAIARVNSRTVFRWVQEGHVHFIETTQGLLLVCLKSLL
jgi:hypothetical protein